MRKKELIAIIGLLAFSIVGCASGKNTGEDAQTESAAEKYASDNSINFVAE